MSEARSQRLSFRLGQLCVDRVDLSAALCATARLVEKKRGGIIFTPNVDHVVLASEDEAFREAYAAADLSLADGMPVVWASHLLGMPVPEKISGSDFVEPLMVLAAMKGWRVYLFGGANGVAKCAASELVRRHPRLNIVGTNSARIDFALPASRRENVIAEIRKASPDLVLVALGAPKQERWIHESASSLRPAVLLGVGASLDFLAGTATRAPAWMSSSGLEWLYRLWREPARMWRRYLLRDPKFLTIVLSDLFQRHFVARKQQGSVP